MDFLQHIMLITVGLFASAFSTWACNSKGYHECNQQLKAKLANFPESEICSVKDVKLEEFTQCVNRQLTGCHPGIARPQRDNMEAVLESYSQLCPAMNDEDEEEEEEPEIDVQADDAAVESRKRMVDESAMAALFGGSVGQASSRFGLCESAGPSNCARDLNKALDPYISDLTEFCKRVVEVLAVYRACVEAVISGCPTQTREQHRANMKTHIEGYQHYIKQCQQEGCPDLETREEGMDGCIDNSAVSDAEGATESCRALKEEVDCAWGHAAGCPDTEERFTDEYGDLMEEYNDDYDCGISVGGAVNAPAPTQPSTTPPSIPSTTPVTTQPAMSNCLALKERGCFPEEHLSGKEAVEDVLVLLKHLEAIHAGQTPAYRPICQVFARMFHFDGKVTCTVQAVRQCFGQDYLKGFDPMKFSKEIKENCFKMQIAPVQECFH